MAFSSGYPSISIEDIYNQGVTELDILVYYIGIKAIPCLIKSPLRSDTHPSLSIYRNEKNKLQFWDHAIRKGGGVFDLISNILDKSYQETLNIIYKEIPNIKTAEVSTIAKALSKNNKPSSKSKLFCKIREWKDYDKQYWESFGITLKWLDFADVYPISHKIIMKEDNKYTFRADKYAYAYVERKEEKVTLKIYQPFNTKGFKWSNKHDKSVLSLWTKLPKKGNNVCICSSLKDALCLWANAGIPSIAVQGEGYNISNTAMTQLKERFKSVYILFDNDEVGLLDGQKLEKLTGFKNIVLPSFKGGKDISDLYYILQDKHKFKDIILDLFK